MTFSPFDFDVCTSPEEQEAAARRFRPARAREAGTVGGGEASPADVAEQSPLDQSAR